MSRHQEKPEHIRVTCPNGHRLRVSESKRGRRVKCVVCSLPFRVPVSGETASAETGSASEREADFESLIGMKFRLMPAGDFLMGCPDSEAMGNDHEMPQHRVRITQPYYLGLYPVSQDEYRRVAGSVPSKVQGDGRCPVVDVLWTEAIAFCNRLSEQDDIPPYYRFESQSVSIMGGTGYRLPTEAEWEYACRAGSKTSWSFGNDASRIGEHAWYDRNSKNRTYSVGQKKPNPWGLYDMHGNVWEWCWDWYGRYEARLASDPLGPETGDVRVLRGGSFCLGAVELRSTFRYYFSPALRSIYHFGFRVAKNPS